MMLFLYKTYAGLNKSNTLFEAEIEKISKQEKIKKIIYLDITQAMKITIQNQEKNEDVVFMQTPNSLHRRIHPYVAYVVKEKKLYRLESLREFSIYPLESEGDFVVDELGEVEIFRIYPSREQNKNLYLVHTLFQSKDEVLLKVKALNIKQP